MVLRQHPRLLPRSARRRWTSGGGRHRARGGTGLQRSVRADRPPRLLRPPVGPCGARPFTPAALRGLLHEPVAPVRAADGGYAQLRWDRGPVRGGRVWACRRRLGRRRRLHAGRGAPAGATRVGGLAAVDLRAWLVQVPALHRGRPGASPASARAPDPDRPLLRLLQQRDGCSGGPAGAGGGGDRKPARHGQSAAVASTAGPRDDAHVGHTRPRELRGHRGAACRHTGPHGPAASASSGTGSTCHDSDRPRRRGRAPARLSSVPWPIFARRRGFTSS